MKKLFVSALLVTSFAGSKAQNVMTPELLWSLGRVSPETVSADGKSLIYGVRYYNTADNKGETNLYALPLTGGDVKQITSTAGTESNVMVLPGGKMGYLYNGQLYSSEWDGTQAVKISDIEGGIANARISPDGQYILFSQEVKTKNATSDLYPQLPKANAVITDQLMFRHWDSWEDDKSNHVFYAPLTKNSVGTPKDIMAKEPFDCPQMPFGGVEDMIWSADSRNIFYVCKKKKGTEYALSTNTDIYKYNLPNDLTFNMTQGMEGYDTNPDISPDGNKIIWLSMEHDGYEADKNRIELADFGSGVRTDLTAGFDETVESIRWSNDGTKIYFIAPKQSSLQLYEIDVAKAMAAPGTMTGIRQVTDGQFDISAMIEEVSNARGAIMLVTKTDMNHAAEIYGVNLNTGELKQLSKINDAVYSKLSLSTVEQYWIPTFDAQRMLINVILPPGFDKNKKYPVLIYCQGGPQSALTQFYSFRWNFQLMAAHGYVVIAACRRGMPGFGTQWNQLISADWGGRAIKDYLYATDWAKKLQFADSSRFAAVGASYGGYAVYMMAGMHDGRFKTFIAHDGLFNTESFYGTTEEMWFADYDMGGAYWIKGKQNPSYTTSNPKNYINNWNTPILIFQGGRDYRTTEDQAFQAFTAAQVKGIKSRLVYLPDEGHWVLSPQDAMLWQSEFYKWLNETL